MRKAYRRLAGRWAWNVLSFARFQGAEARIRRRAVARLELQPGDAVLDVACGRGSNFPYLQRAVGEQGRIVGVDYSPDMLAGAAEAVRRRGWGNVELVEGDAAEISYRSEFDATLCTIAISVIPGWQETLRRMVEAARPGGSVVVMDGRLGTGWRRVGNAYARLFGRVVVADLGRDIPSEFRTLLPDAAEETMLFGAYFVISGVTPTKDEDSHVQTGR